MKSSRNWLTNWLALLSGAALFCFLTSLPALAAEEAKPDPSESPVGQIFKWINFLVVFGGIAFLIAKHGGAFFRGNAKEIAASITEAQAAKAEADRELSDVNSKISRADTEVTELRAAARRDADAEAERLRASGQAEIEKINVAARAELKAAERVAQQQLRELAASAAVERAGVLVSSRMTPETRERLLRSFLGKLDRSAN
jgi:F0F1-type ATP synthase membrane subunit b/b'